MVARIRSRFAPIGDEAGREWGQARSLISGRIGVSLDLLISRCPDWERVAVSLDLLASP